MTPSSEPLVPIAPPAASWWSRHQISVVPWLFLLPALVMFGVYVIGPIFESIALSFYDWDGLGVPAGHHTAVRQNNLFSVRSLFSMLQDLETANWTSYFGENGQSQH